MRKLCVCRNVFRQLLPFTQQDTLIFGTVVPAHILHVLPWLIMQNETKDQIIGQRVYRSAEVIQSTSVTLAVEK